MLHDVVLFKLLKGEFDYLTIETKWTIHHIERTNYTDRGKIKWIAETKSDAFENMKVNEEARNSHIDAFDLFPRLYFNPQCFLLELFSWLRARNLEIINMEERNLA